MRLKKYIKQFTAIALSTALLFFAAGCGKTTGSGTSSDSGSSSGSHSGSTNTGKGNGKTSGSSWGGNDSEEFDTFLQELFLEEMRDNTLNLHFTIKNPDAYGLGDLEPTLGDLDDRDFSDEAEDWDDMKETFAELESYDYDSLTEKQQFTYDVLHKYMEQEMAMEGCKYMGTIFGQVSGVQSNMPLNMSLYEFYSAKDIEDYLVLLDEFDEYFEYCVAYEEYRTEQGYGMSDSIVNDAVEQCETFLEHREDNYLITTFDHKVDEMDLSDSEKEAYKDRNRNIVLNTVIPAYEDTIDSLYALKGKCEDKGGLCNYEDGKKYYEYILAHKTGSSKSVEEMEKNLLGVLDDATEMMYDVYQNAPEVYMEYYDDEDYQVAGLSEPEEFLEYYKSQMTGSYPTPPAVNYKISDIDPAIADIVSPAFCVTPCIDDYTNGVIQVNRSEDNHSSGALSSTYAHEGYPGHLYQMTYYLSTDPYPIRNCLNFLGYDEGWAVYVEMRSYNLIEYTNYNSKYVREMYICNELMNMAFCCLADIYVNYYGYTENQLADFMNENGFNGDMAGDLYPMMVEEPGYYPQYFVGYLEFVELRDYAMEKLGKNFDEVAYHKVILDAGPCSFDTLRTEMDKYIDSVK